MSCGASSDDLKNDPSSASRQAEVLPWPDCGRPSNTFTHPTPDEAAKLPKPTSFRV